MTRFLILICALVVAGCSAKPEVEPRIQTLSDVTLAQDAVSLAIAEAVGGDVIAAEVVVDPAPKAGFFGQFFGGGAKATAVVDPVTPVVEAEGNAVLAALPEVVSAKPAPKRGLFSRMFGVGTKSANAVQETPAENTPAVPAPQQAGFLSGVFAPKAAPARTGPDARDVSIGTKLPYGEIARNCTVSRRLMGTKVDENAGYTLYDTDRNATGLRTHYIVGFKDNCARQFTAATSLMGDIGTHEVVRYLPSNARVDYSVTDTAYEGIKSSYCRVGHGKPCGGRLDRLARRTTFITAYERFGSNPTWSNILLHDGRVAAMGPAEK